MAAEDASKQKAGGNQSNQQQAAGNNGFTVTTTGGAQGGNADKINQNNERITFLSTEFKVSANVINRNRVKITKFQSSIKTKTKKFQKKTKLATKKAKATEKKEKEKQKKLKVQLGAVGIAENVFAVTSATGLIVDTTGKILEASGTAMLSNPFTAAAGSALVASGLTCQSVGTTLNTIGLYGTLACGVTKATINIANGNLAAGLMALGQTAVSAALSMVGASAVSNNTLTLVSQGLSVVSSSADMVNNVRAVQGKEASGLASKISTVAGVGSAVTGVAGSFGNFAQSGTLSKVAKIGTAVGTALSSTSQMMSTFGGESKAANILGMVGGAINTVSSVASIAGAKKDQANAKATAQREAQENKDRQAAKESLDKQIAEHMDKMNKERVAMMREMEAEFNGNSQPTTPVQEPTATSSTSSNSTSSEVPKYLAAPTENSQYDGDKIDYTQFGDYTKQQSASTQNDVSYPDMSMFQTTPNTTITTPDTTKINKSDMFNTITQGIGAATSVASAFLQNGQNGGNQQQNKKAPAAYLDKRTKNIMKKNRKQRANTKKMLESQRKIAALKKLRAAV